MHTTHQGCRKYQTGWNQTKISCQVQFTKFLRKSLIHKDFHQLNLIAPYIALLSFFLLKCNISWQPPFLVAIKGWQPHIFWRFFQLGFCPSQKVAAKFLNGLAIRLGSLAIWRHLSVTLLHTAQCTLNKMHFTLHTIHYNLHTVQYTM